MSTSWRFCLRVFVVFCISVSTTSCSKVKWATPGESITIKCECKESPEEAIQIKVTKGPEKNADIFSKTKFSKEVMAYPDRTQIYGKFPNFQILLKHLTTNDTGVYWCDYKQENNDVAGEGSLLLVVRVHSPGGDKSTVSPPTCDLANKNLVVTLVSISSAVLIAFFIVLLLFAIRKVKFCHGEYKPRPIPHNEVYEDMRGTIRR
ncbi:uncharacterized protein [Eucyclogobius newberryi]|uniref:uncharacterized protein n=1 Tax=Eucyclogobius newberryi TaxID=166745 RepID=UPI003B5AF03B